MMVRRAAMRQTSDVRREVAEQLRMLQHTTYYREEIVENICDAINIADPVNAFREPEDVYECLADLIDPTCRNKQIAFNKTAPEEFRTDNFICSACGETFCADGDGVNHPIDWAYCPNCGARVTGVDA